MSSDNRVSGEGGHGVDHGCSWSYRTKNVPETLLPDTGKKTAGGRGEQTGTFQGVAGWLLRVGRGLGVIMQSERG